MGGARRNIDERAGAYLLLLVAAFHEPAPADDHVDLFVAGVFVKRLLAARRPFYPGDGHPLRAKLPFGQEQIRLLAAAPVDRALCRRLDVHTVPPVRRGVDRRWLVHAPTGEVIVVIMAHGALCLRSMATSCAGACL